MKNLQNLKIICFGDIHGRNCWKKIIDENINKVDLFIFLGDYFTSREGISEEDQFNNFKEIVEYKEMFPDQIILLRGNHDMEACGYYWAECYPSYRESYIEDRFEWFLENTQWCIQIDNILFSHAGITKRWFEDMKKKYPEIMCFDDINKIEPNEMFGFRANRFSDRYGDSETQPLTWVRPATLCEYGYENIIYIVGHSTRGHIVNYKDTMKGDWVKCDVWLCDTLPREYLLIDNGKFNIIKNG